MKKFDCVDYWCIFVVVSCIAMACIPIVLTFSIQTSRLFINEKVLNGKEIYLYTFDDSLHCYIKVNAENKITTIHIGSEYYHIPPLENFTTSLVNETIVFTLKEEELLK